MYIAMNRFKVAPGSEAAFEEMWTSRVSFLPGVPGFVEFHLLRGPDRDDHVLYFSHTIWAEHADFEAWTGVAKPHARQLWAEVEGELDEVSVGGEPGGWILREDVSALDAPPSATGIRLLPPGDPYLQKPNRALLAPDADLRKRLFRPVASPGAVLKDGRLVGLWRVKAKGRKAQITVEKLGRVARKDLEPEAQRIADLRGASEAILVVD